MTFLRNIARLGGALESIFLPYRIGFIPGHYHLSQEQIDEIKHVLNALEDSSVIQDYERRFALSVGTGYACSFAAGRMAFFAILKAMQLGEGDEVILPSFTCSVMPNAVWRVGAKPVFSDVDIRTFGSNAESIEKCITKNTKVIVAQHSFGIPCDIEAIVQLGKKLGIFIIEDCAIAFDSSVNNIKVGNWGDASFFSTDHSKPINTMIGGIAYTKNEFLFKKVCEIAKESQSLSREHQVRLHEQFEFERKFNVPDKYPRLPFYNLIRNISIAYKKGWRSRGYTFLEADYCNSKPSNFAYPYPAKMPVFLARLGIFELERWPEELKRRKGILEAYINISKELGLVPRLPVKYFDKRCDIVPLRMALRYPERNKIFKKMKFIDTDWTWFREPVICCPAGPEAVGYIKGSCPATEKLCKEIVNWPCIIPEGWERKIFLLFKEVFKSETKGYL